MENELEVIALENDKLNKKIKIYQNENQEMNDEFFELQEQVSA